MCRRLRMVAFSLLASRCFCTRRIPSGSSLFSSTGLSGSSCTARCFGSCCHWVICQRCLISRDGQLFIRRGDPVYCLACTITSGG